MITEYQVRRRLTEIGASNSSAPGRLRQLLRLSRDLRRQATEFSHLADRIPPERSERSPNAYRRLARHYDRLRDDVRIEARLLSR